MIQTVDENFVYSIRRACTWCVVFWIAMLLIILELPGLSSSWFAFIFDCLGSLGCYTGERKARNCTMIASGGLGCFGNQLYEGSILRLGFEKVPTSVEA